MAFVKLDTAILDSTLWLSSADTRVVFITMLAMAQPDGMVESTAPGIARRANMEISRVRAALEELEAPDPDSRTMTDEGRRVQRVDGGYWITNYTAYRDKDHGAKDRMRRYRQRQREARDGSDDSRNESGALRRNGCNVSPDVTQAYTEAEAYTEEEPSNARADAREPEDSGPAIVATMPLKDGTTYEITAEQRDHWQELFPTVSVDLSLGAMRAWCESNPAKQKTRRGVSRFITSWLTRDMNEGRNVRTPDRAGSAAGGGQPTGRRAPPEGEASIDGAGAPDNYGGSSDEEVDAFTERLRGGSAR